MTTALFDSVSSIDWSNWKAKDIATLMFIIKDGKILLIRKKRGLGAGKINGPGGKLDPGETPEQCAVREVQEELLVTPENISYHGISLFQFTDGYSIHVYIFSATDFKGTPTETDEAIPLWFELDRIPYQEMWEDDGIWLPLVLKGQRFHGKYIFDGDSMVDHELVNLGPLKK
ncbi:8-oxo-dGTP diphosphatase [Sansalvadorimonas sp. 2012CJ34-2]|uniref:Oxidized purine nucleoside triphosphate hydrolase n=1 Tax=Parendozoicomonas callyspongiae TaxID=2942213 RepID=A0ABT0PFA9_9GAMM|nr:8-oxo-dGTP diphosphatase [Sansalvadorimonas sp. 2012CJ34-2]MCL6269452.1 8-oxo-dGTP diphosphatase [Sansalvadorimonas sp. 2012CJ34-2]